MFKKTANTALKSTLVVISLAFLASIAGFAIFCLYLHHEGLKTRTERLYYLPYQVVQAEQAKLDGARVPLKFHTREVEPGVYEHSLQIHSCLGKSLARMPELGLELSATSEWKLISAKITYPGGNGQEGTLGYATSEQKKQGTNSSILLMAIPGAEKANPGLKNALLTIKSNWAPELSVWAQKSIGKPVSEILWTTFSNTEGGAVYASLSGWFRYSEEGVPRYSKAQLLAHTWGMGVGGNKTIYTLVGIAFLFWISGMGLLLVPDLLAKVIPRFLAEAVGCGLIFGSICLIFSFIFPPFQGPDEVHHFSGYIESSGREKLASYSLDIANLGAFDRIHRKDTEKLTSIDVAFNKQAEWPLDTISPYVVGRSPLGMKIWKGVKGYINAQNAGYAMLQLRVVNGFFVAASLLFALAVAGSIFPKRSLAAWFSAPVLLIPCIAHYSTVVSNYPFLIGGYVIQMVVLGILWASLDSEVLLSRHFAKIGTLLGIGMGIALCSADNAMVTLPFWGLALPIWFMALGLSSKGSSSGVSLWSSFYGLAIAGAFMICVPVGLMSTGHTFFPERVVSMLINTMPGHGNGFVACTVFLAAYLTSVGGASLLTCRIGTMLNGCASRIPWRIVGMSSLITGVVLLILTKTPYVPEIDYSRGGGTTVLRYALSITGGFFHGLVPKQLDFFAAESFWRNLGWLETRLPFLEMEILRIAMGVGITLLVWTSLRREDSGESALFAAGSLVALAACLATIGVLYYIVLFNVNSRYILVAYLFSAVLAMEGYRKFFQASQGRELPDIAATTTICILAMSFQSWAWCTILARYF